MPNCFFKFPAFLICLSLFILVEAKPSSGVYFGKPSTLELFLKSNVYSNAEKITMKSELTAYCIGPCCNSGYVIENSYPVQRDWSNMIAAGDISMKALIASGIRFAAVDTSIIPFGSIIRYKGIYYAALDRGGKIRGKMVDLGVILHSEAESFGRMENETIEVFIPKDSRHALSMILDYAGKFTVKN
jgi:3D (Asp-Asp-Asp) domain-containing protein